MDLVLLIGIKAAGALLMIYLINSAKKDNKKI